MKRIFLKFLAVIYRMVYKLHHAVFLRQKYRLEKSKLIVVGSYRAGGAGKTPVVFELAKKYLDKNYSVLILVHSVAFDEEILLQNLLKEYSLNVAFKVLKTKNRAKAAHIYDGLFDIILCDDGFEDTRLCPNEKILLDWGDSCQSVFDLWPSGKCRSLEKDHANVTKKILMNSNVFSIGSLTFYADFILGNYIPLNLKDCFKISKNVAVVCGLGDPERFLLDVKIFLKEFDICEVRFVFCKDHDKNFARILERTANSALKKKERIWIIVSAKDACRLSVQKCDINVLKYVLVTRQICKFELENS